MVTTANSRRSTATERRFIGKPNGKIQERVKQCGPKQCGPEHFGIISVDCPKRRSKWMLCDFFGSIRVCRGFDPAAGF
jgi:hypothetical protein